jgi:hypothetical protein
MVNEKKLKERLLGAPDQKPPQQLIGNPQTLDEMEL